MSVNSAEILNQDRVRKLLEDGNLRRLFIEELGWDHSRTALDLSVDGKKIRLVAVAQKRDLGVYEYQVEQGEPFPTYAERSRIESATAKVVREHLIIFSNQDRHHQVWQWAKREIGRPIQRREHAYYRLRRADLLIQKLGRLFISLDAEENITVIDVAGRLKAGFDVEPITKRFYDGFQAEHNKFLGAVSGIRSEDVRKWYTSIMLNRLMFVYFIQEKGFLNSQASYLQTKLAESQKKGKDRYFRDYLFPLFFECLAKPEGQRSAECAQKIGHVPFLNGGLFKLHQIEIDNPRIDISDKAFAELFAFFESYRWHLDERPVSEGNEINPDVLGYIFEKYINQRQMGAYYTKEDVTEYICGSTILPRLLDLVYLDDEGFSASASVAKLLSRDPDRYIWPDVLHGVDLPVPGEVAQALDRPGDVMRNRAAPPQFALAKETWSQYLHRRSAANTLRRLLASGECRDVDALITFNLNIGQLVQDLLEDADEREIASWWRSITQLTILDPACGSGAFLFAALKTLQPLYETLLDAMAGIVTDQDRAGGANDEADSNWMRQILRDIERHPNPTYFVLKSIALNNLFGVDIMEEATEICKLRLFLKLVAQVDDMAHIEPLPDLDFNVRVGNSLVGLVSRADFDNLKELPLDYESVKARIEEQSEVADRQFDLFRDLQVARTMDTGAFSRAKDELQESLRRLAEECNAWLARQYGKNPTNGRIMEAWLSDYQPFNWFAEFHGVFKNGGFDVIIGNPPYVNKSKVNYIAAAVGEPVFPDIYGNFILRSLNLKHLEGRCGLIVPLSLTFSEDFVELRKRIFESSSNWVSSFDNIPAAIFTGVSQRCSIWINSPRERSLAVTPMCRWRSDFRTHLLATLRPHKVGRLPKPDFGIPKLDNVLQERVLELHIATSAKRPDLVFGARGSAYAVGFGAAARNFISVFIKLPPELDAETLKRIEKTKAGFVKLASKKSENAALAMLAGDTFFWYWLARGDGFDVTSWIVRDFVACLGGLSDTAMQLLADIGSALQARSYECLVFKKNAGKYVGNLNYAALSTLTHAADEVVLHSLGASRAERDSIYDYVQRLKSINEFAGEKSVPAAVKAKFRPKPVDPQIENGIIRRVNAYLVS